MEAEVDALRRARERVLELVAISVLRGGRNDRLERRIDEATDPDERVAHLPLLLRDLHVVREVLETTAAADAEVRARRLDAVRRSAGRRSVTTPSANPRFTFVTRARTSSPGRPPADEDDEAVVPRDAAPAVGERVDAQLELLSFADGRSHGPPA